MFHMRYWTISLAMFLMATFAEAQVRSGRPGLRGVTPGFGQSAGVLPPPGSFPRQNLVIVPQLPYYAYFPYDESYPGMYNSQPPYSPDQSADSEQINSLNDQVQQLTNEVQRLQNELEATRTQPIQPAVIEVTPSIPPPPIKPTVLVFENGQKVKIQGYAIVGSTLWTNDQDGLKKIPLSDLNLDATRKENLKHGVNFLPQK
jgi:hypothetical protein